VLLISQSSIDLKFLRNPSQLQSYGGVYLEVVENERIVLTDAYTSAWEPSEKPFMTMVVTFADEEGKTRYTARVRHWTVADREAHEAMGFHQGWGQCADQLAEVAATLAR